MALMAKNNRKFSPWVLVGVAVVSVVLFGVGGGLISAFEACIVDPYTTFCNYVRAPPRCAIKNDGSNFDLSMSSRRPLLILCARRIRLRHVANCMAFLGHLLHGPCLPLAWITQLALLVRSLDNIPRLTATSSCSVQPRNRIREWGELWHCAATTTLHTTLHAALHAALRAALRTTTAILRRTSPVPSTYCTFCIFKGNIHYYSALTTKCACAAVPSGGIRIHSGTSATTAYRQDLRPLRGSCADAGLSEVRVRSHDCLMYIRTF
jgi:hypothetical protein